MDKINIGLILLIIILIGVIVYMAIKKTKEETEEPEVDPEEWPEPSYMNRIGKYCPTGWVYKGIMDRKDVCHNQYNIPINDINKEKYCYDSQNKQIKLFPTFTKNWEDCLLDTSKCTKQACSRKEWITKCGIAPEQEAQWIGFDKLSTSCPKSTY